MAGEQNAKGGAEPTEVVPGNPTDAEAELEQMSGSESAATEAVTEAAEEGTTEATEKAEVEEQEQEETEHRSGRAEARIAELTKARKEQEERATAAEAKAKALEEKAAHEIGLHPDYLSAEEAKLIQEANKLEAREQWLIKHLEGYDDPKDGAKSLTPAEVREELAGIRSRVTAKVARAQALYEERLAQQTADLLAGRKARLEREELERRAKLGKPGGKPAAKIMAPAAASVARPMAAPGDKRGMSEERFAKSGADRAAAARELQELAGGD